MALKNQLGVIAAAALLWTGSLNAQDVAPSDKAPDEEALSDEAPSDETQTAEQEAAPIDQDSDDFANQLNASQQLQQTFTLQRTINGKVVETTRKTVNFDKSKPVRATEAGQTTLQRLTGDFDRAVLTRTEAFEEAKIDFTIADLDRDGFIDRDEFVFLVENWRASEDRGADAPTDDIQADREIQELLKIIDPERVAKTTQDTAIEKFSFWAGPAPHIDRKTFVTEYLRDFDAMDADEDSLLRGDELNRFRAQIRGERL